MHTNFKPENGYATREECREVLNKIDMLDISDGEFNYVIAARNGTLHYGHLERLKDAAKRQAEARAASERVHEAGAA